MQFEYRYFKFKLLTQRGLKSEIDESTLRSFAKNRERQTTKAALTTAEALIALGEHQEAADFLIAYLNDPTGVNTDKVEIYDQLTRSLKKTDDLIISSLLYFRISFLIPGSLKPLFELAQTLLALVPTESNKEEEILPLVLERLLTNAEPSNKRYAGTKERQIPASVQLDERPLREAHILHLFEQLAPGILNLKNVRPDLLKALLVQILKGPEGPAQAFETALKTTEKADWKIIEVLDSIELKRPKAKKKGGKANVERALVDKALNRMSRWKETIQNRINIEEPKKRKGWIQDKFTGIQDPLFIEKVFEKIPSPLTHEEELFLSLAQEAIKEVAAEVAPYLPEEGRDSMLKKIESGEASFLDLASAELAHFTPHWENITQDIPTFLSDAKKTDSKDRSDLFTNTLFKVFPHKGGEEASSLTESELNLLLAFHSMTQFLKPHQKVLSELMQDEMEQIVELTKQFMLLEGIDQEATKDNLTFEKIKEILLAEIIRHFMIGRYDFLGERLIEREDILAALETQMDDDLDLIEVEDHLKERLMKKFKVLYPFYATEIGDETIFTALFDTELSADQTDAYLSRKSHLKVIHFLPTAVDGIPFDLVVDLKSSRKTPIKLYFPIAFNKDLKGELSIEVKKRIPFEVARQEEDILQALKKIEAEQERTITPPPLMPTNYHPENGGIPLLEFDEQWKKFSKAKKRKLDMIEVELPISLMVAIARALHRGTTLTAPSSRNMTETTTLHFIPLLTSEGKMKIFTIRKNSNGDFLSITYKDPIGFLTLILLLDSDSLDSFNVEREITGRRGTQIFVTPNLKRNKLIYKNPNGLYGMEFVWWERKSKTNILPVEEPESDLVDISFLLNSSNGSTPSLQEEIPSPIPFRVFPKLDWHSPFETFRVFDQAL